MTPVEHMVRLYEGRPDMSLMSDLYAHMVTGYVVANPQVIAMARAVRRDWQPKTLADPMIAEPLETADCWFVWLLCGSLREAVKHLPYHLPWFGFSQRGQPARFVEAEKVLAKIG